MMTSNGSTGASQSTWQEMAPEPADSDALSLTDDNYPWSPARGVTLGEVFDHWNVDRSGLLHKGGETYYFENIVGDGEPAGIWAYSRLRLDEVHDVLTTADPDELDEVTTPFFQGRWVTVAVVADYRIIDWAILKADPSSRRLDLAQGVLDLWRRKQERAKAATKAVDLLQAV